MLDDSRDPDCIRMAQERVAHYAGLGVPIRQVRRVSQRGYKAGNLAYGMRQAQGEFFVIFDADFVPPADFLLRTLPSFQDPSLGFLQTGIGFENRNYSFLTRFQAMEMGHQQFVTEGLYKEGAMVSLSGSSCVWRRTCVESLGGWNSSTVTEDVDLGYRAQLGEWRYAYLPDVVSMSRLPDTVSAFRMQRERWERGLIHSAFKHSGEMWRQPMSFKKRLHAIAMMFSSLLLAAIFILVLLSLPLNYLVDFEGPVFRWGAPIFFVLVTIWALNNAFGARYGSQKTSESDSDLIVSDSAVFDSETSGSVVSGDEDHQKEPGLFLSLWYTYLYVAMFLPMAWYYFAGGVRAMFGVHGGFHPTPKGEQVERSDLPRIHRVLVIGEVLTFLYSCLALWVAYLEANYVLIPLNVTVCVGFGMVLYGSWQERLQHARR